MGRQIQSLQKRSIAGKYAPLLVQTATAAVKAFDRVGSVNDLSDLCGKLEDRRDHIPIFVPALHGVGIIFLPLFRYTFKLFKSGVLRRSVAIMYSQLFNLLCTKADNSLGGKLTYHVRCLLDEFANIGEIPQFEKLIATIRSREISASIILQAKSQLKAIYKDNADTIEDNCDTMLFLGGKEKSTLKEISESLGKERSRQAFKACTAEA